MADKALNGIVSKSTGSWYEVLSQGKTYNCRIRGRMRLKGVRTTNPVVVGDRVLFEADLNGEYSIFEVEQRTNYVIRRASNLSKESHIIASNIDRALLVTTLFSPATPTEFIDRFLITCEAYKIPVTIILSKIDLARQDEAQVELFRHTYAAAGYEVLEVSAKTGEGIESVAQLLHSKTTLIAGNSGVGKSSIVAAIEPSLDEIRIGEISQSHHKGRHTTTFSTMYPLTSGGYIIDTPGIKGFGLIDIEQQELYHYMPEIMKVANGCKFYNCTHTHEPGCAVVAAVEQGTIAYSRYESYLKIMDEDDKYR